MTIVITGLARASLQKIYSYFRSKGAGMKGREIRKKVLEISKLLVNNPQMGQKEVYLEHLNQDHRYIPVMASYKIIYRIIGQTIYITDVFDTRQAPGKIKG